MSKRILSINIQQVTDEDPDTSYLEEDDSRERLEAYNRGHFGYIGIRAVALVQFKDNLTQEISSGGLWGIEDDSDRDYLKTVAEEELDQLAEELHAAGFSKRTVTKAIRQAA